MMKYAIQPNSYDTSASSASMPFPCLCDYPDVSWFFEESTGDTRTADENTALQHNRDETAHEQWLPFFLQGSKRLD